MPLPLPPPVQGADAPVEIRLIHRDDGPRLQGFMQSLSEESRYFRFLEAIRELPPSLLRYFIEVDFDRDMALVAVTEDAPGESRIVGVTRYYGDDDGAGCEFALAVADAWHHRGLGHRLMAALAACAVEHGYRHMHGDVLADNLPMLHLMAQLGFSCRTAADDPGMRLVSRILTPVGRQPTPARPLPASPVTDRTVSGPANPCS